MSDQEEVRRWAQTNGLPVNGIGEVAEDAYELHNELNDLGLGG
jgi:hypothetical protein